MNERRRLALRKENLTELTGYELHGVAGGAGEVSGGKIETCFCSIATCVDTYTIATCACPTGASCICPTGAGCV